MFSALLLAACTHGRGRDFGTLSTAGLVPGATTEQQVVARYGQPSSRSTLTRNQPPISAQPHPASTPALAALVTAALKSEFMADFGPGIYSNVRYEYSQIGLDRELRTAAFSFHNNKLVSYELASSFPADATAFDIEKASALLVARNATMGQVMAALGPPSGRIIYPLTRAPGHERWIYHSLRYHDGLTDNARLEIAFDETGRELDYRIQATSQPTLVTQASGPIFLPGPMIAARGR